MSLASDGVGALWIIPNGKISKREFELFSGLRAGNLGMLTDGKVIAY